MPSGEPGLWGRKALRQRENKPNAAREVAARLEPRPGRERPRWEAPPRLPAGAAGRPEPPRRSRPRRAFAPTQASGLLIPT